MINNVKCLDMTNNGNKHKKRIKNYLGAGI